MSPLSASPSAKPAVYSRAQRADAGQARLSARIFIQQHLCRVGQAGKGKFAVHRHQADRLVVDVLDLGARLLVDLRIQRFARERVHRRQEGLLRLLRLLLVQQFDGLVKDGRVQVLVTHALGQGDRFGDRQRDRGGQHLLADLRDRFGHVAQGVVDQLAQAAAVGCRPRLQEGGGGQRDAHLRLHVFEHELRDVRIVAEVGRLQHFLHERRVDLDAQVQPRPEQQRKPRRQRDHEDGDVGPDELLLQVRLRLPRGGAAVGGPIGFRFHR